MRSDLVRVADYVINFFAARGVQHVFSLPGGGAMHLVDAAGRCESLRYIVQHHEQACGIAAEAYARVTENLGLALVTTGPGGTNIVTPAVGAWLESAPLVVVSGQVKRADMKRDSGVRQRGPQEVDIVSIVKDFTKYAVTVDEPEAIRFHLEKAVYMALEGRRGPVWIDIPLDVQGAQVDPDTLRGFEAPPVLDATIAAVTAGIERLRELWVGAERPLLLVGHGVRLSGAAETVVRVAEALNLPVVTTWPAMDLMPSDHPLFVGRPGVIGLRAANFAVQNCDLLIAVGARLDNVVTAFNPAEFARSATRIVVDIDPAELAKQPDSIADRVLADAGAFMSAFADAGLTPLAGTEWRAACERWKARWTNLDGAIFPEEGPIGHYHVVERIAEVLPEDTMIVTGSSGLGIEAVYSVFKTKRGQRVMHSAGLGAMGYGLPAAIGAGLARPGKLALIETDGSLQLNVQEFATLKGLGLPLVIFLLNNEGYASIRTTQRAYFQGHYVGTTADSGLVMPDWQALAAAYGVRSMKISDASELADGLRRAWSEPGPFLCEIALVTDEQLRPRVAAIPQPGGGMLSMPLEDMSPLLSLAELEAEMLVPLTAASLQAERPTV